MSKKSTERLTKLPLEGRCGNHFEIAFTEFEFLLDVGQIFANSGKPIVHTRLIMTPHAAETLENMLERMLADYKATVGPIGRRAS